MEGTELRRRLKRLGRSYVELAPLLGLSIGGLHKQLRGDHAVSKQTEIILTQVVEKQRLAGGSSAAPMVPLSASARPVTPRVPPVRNDTGHRDLARRGVTTAHKQPVGPRRRRSDQQLY